MLCVPNLFFSLYYKKELFQASEEGKPLTGKRHTHKLVLFYRTVIEEPIDVIPPLRI